MGANTVFVADFWIIWKISEIGSIYGKRVWEIFIMKKHVTQSNNVTIFLYRFLQMDKLYQVLATHLICISRLHPLLEFMFS